MPATCAICDTPFLRPSEPDTDHVHHTCVCGQQMDESLVVSTDDMLAVSALRREFERGLDALLDALDSTGTRGEDASDDYTAF